MFAGMPSRRYLLPIAIMVVATTIAPGIAGAQSDCPVLCVVRPAARVVWRSGVPDARGDGAATTGVGLNLHLRAGMEGRIGPIIFRLAPELTVAENREYATFAGRDPGRSVFASPFYAGEFSADLPSRFGDAPLTRLHAGESGVWWTGTAGSLAVLTALPQWGPGVGEGLVLGRSAPGFPRVEAALNWQPRAGKFRFRWFGGAVQESQFFDPDPSNDRRSVAGARVEYARPGRMTLDAGLSRTVMDGRADRGFLSAGVLPLLRTATDSVLELVSADLLLRDSLAGTTVWLEAVRQTPVRSVRELVRMPTEGLAFRVGLAQRVLTTARATWLTSVEFVRLDQSGQRSDRVPRDLYTSTTVVQGWTHRGQPLGSGLGPGGQRQYGRIDRIGTVWRLSGFAERIRWNDDALFREPAPYLDRHDVTLQAGLRAARAVGGYDMAAKVSVGKRLNHLFQGASSSPGNRAVDVRVVEFALSFVSR